MFVLKPTSPILPFGQGHTVADAMRAPGCQKSCETRLLRCLSFDFINYDGLRTASPIIDLTGRMIPARVRENLSWFPVRDDYPFAVALLKDAIASSVLANISNTVSSFVICSTSFA